MGRLDWRQVGLGVAIGLVLGAAVHLLNFQRRHDPGRRMDRFARRLDLTPEQRTQVEAIFKEGREKMEAVRAEGKMKLRAVLTPEQQAKFERIQERRKRRMRH